ncbi:MAG: phosphoribosylanthranilate isomerase [Pedobacter sp.]
MRDSENIREVSLLRPDFMGFIFYPYSKRFVGGLDPLVLSQLPENIAKVGVFVNHDLIEVVQIAERYHLNLLQLHGDESANYVVALKQQLAGSDVKIMKAFGVDEKFNFSALDNYQAAVDYFLFDTQTSEYGGSGQHFNWDLLKRYTLDNPYFLSGGIGLESLESLKKIDDKRLFAVDVNSKFELEPGMKDINKLDEFKKQL